MTTSDSQRLLKEYTRTGSEQAFHELVTGYLDLVYSSAVRLVNGDRHMAEDVAQTVFADLARKARTLPADVLLGGWLHRHTCYVASTVRRSERRRRERERLAAEVNAMTDHGKSSLAEAAEMVDEAIDQLGADDRAAILLRFFEQREFRAVGEALGSSEDAARMRVSRALERLHGLLKKRGVALSAAALGTALAGEAVTAAPAGLAVGISSAALTGAAAGGGATLTLMKIMSMSKLQIGVIGTLIVASVAAPVLVQHRAEAQAAELRQENQSLRQQLDQQEVQAASGGGGQSANNAAGGGGAGQGLPADQFHELLQLRGEVTQLRAQARELAQLKARSGGGGANGAADQSGPGEQLKQQLARMPDRSIPELQLLGDEKWSEDAKKANLGTEDGVREALGNLRRAAKIQFGLMAGKVLEEYVKGNNGELPNDMSELKSLFHPPMDESILQRYQLLRTGKAADLPQGEPVVAEKAPVDDQYDTLIKFGVNTMTVQGVGKWAERQSTTLTF